MVEQSFYVDSSFLRTYNIVQLNHLGMTIVGKGGSKGLTPAHFFLPRALHTHTYKFVYFYALFVRRAHSPITDTLFRMLAAILAFIIKQSCLFN